ncbi:MAG: GTP-binding protein [Roseitalea porphyridii]|uniref:CobW family GTP-binding protein n=1 Tax=Roseitalea porphyridii TaxID=1852022 RepID=UPI0032F058DC
MSDTQTQLPVTVLTGYLGSGKTTLLNRILTENHGRKYAVIVNEFGEVGIDNDLIVDADEEVFEMNNGCICCTVRGDLIRILSGLMKRAGQFDGIIVETTGLADPAPVAQTFFVDEDIAARTRLDAIVTVADARHLTDELGRAPEAQEQIAFGDIVLVNKTDLVGEDDLAAVEARIRRINPTAQIVRTQRADVPLETILGRHAFDLDRILENAPDFLGQENDHHGHDHHGHDHHHHHHDVNRHDEHVSSFSLVSEEPLDPEKFFPWVQTITQEFGIDLLRMKGIVAFPDDPKRYVAQAVHMMLEGDHSRPWREDEPRVSRMVFIGRNLPRDIIEDGFLKCRAKQPAHA